MKSEKQDLRVMIIKNIIDGQNYHFQFSQEADDGNFNKLDGVVIETKYKQITIPANSIKKFTKKLNELAKIWEEKKKEIKK